MSIAINVYAGGYIVIVTMVNEGYGRQFRSKQTV